MNASNQKLDIFQATGNASKNCSLWLIKGVNICKCYVKINNMLGSMSKDFLVGCAIQLLCRYYPNILIYANAVEQAATTMQLIVQ